MVYEAVIANFNRELRDIKTLHHAMPEIRRGVLLCRKTLCRLQETVKKEGFHTRADEIHFFKEVKVHPLSWLIYFTEIGTYQMRKPRTGKDLQKQFYKKQLHKAEKFFRKHRDFSYYMEQGHTHRDTEYFTRQAWEHVPFSPGEDYRDPDSSTSHDFLWARVRAMQRVVDYLQKAQRQFSATCVSADHARAHHELVWTASKVSLAELVYALYSGKVFNHGQADIRDITEAFEVFFNVRLPQVYRTYASIKGRKGQRARFLEELIFHLSQKMDQEEAL
ncbi:RteC domain-containing protein [Sinomicrobium sp. M5D2P9]